MVNALEYTSLSICENGPAHVAVCPPFDSESPHIDAWCPPISVKCAPFRQLLLRTASIIRGSHTRSVGTLEMASPPSERKRKGTFSEDEDAKIQDFLASIEGPQKIPETKRVAKP